MAIRVIELLSMPFIFISYSHKDSEYAHRLAASLEAKGLEVWIDDRIDYGETWPDVIEEQVDGCSALIVVMTPGSHKSKWVKNELSRAQRKGKPVFPLLLEGDPWLSVEATQYVDVLDGSLPPERFYSRVAAIMSAKEADIPQPPGQKVASSSAEVAQDGSKPRPAVQVKPETTKPAKSIEPAETDDFEHLSSHHHEQGTSMQSDDTENPPNADEVRILQYMGNGIAKLMFRRNQEFRTPSFVSKLPVSTENEFRSFMMVELARVFTMPDRKVQYYLDRLRDHGFIVRDPRSPLVSCWEITRKGEEYLITRKLL